MQQSLIPIYFLLAFLPLCGIASHNVSARLEYEMLSSNVCRIRVITLTDPSAALVDRCEVDLEVWNAAGTVKIANITQIPRVNGPLADPNFPISCPGNLPMGEYLTSTIKRNIYEINYVFPGPATYQIFFHDVSRIANLNNMTLSGSVSQFVSASVVVHSTTVQNHSPIITNDSVLTACTQSPWLNQLNIVDPDGDSLSFSLAPCRQYDPPAVLPSTAPGYANPGNAGGGSFWVNAQGNIAWVNASNQLGGFAYALKITEWRNGNSIGNTSYDAVVFVLTNNCVVANGAPALAPGLVVSPNPASHAIRLNRIAEHLELYDLQGRLLRSSEFADQMSVEGLPEGVFLLKVHCGDQVVVRRVMVGE